MPAWLDQLSFHSLHLHASTSNSTVVTLDELVANVKHAQDIWVWTICDEKTKLIPIIQLGPRTQAMASAMVHKLITRLKVGCVPLLVRMASNITTTL